MSIEEASGDKLIPSRYEVVRWQHRLFTEIRRETKYRRLIAEIRGVWGNQAAESELPETLRYGFWFGDEVDRSSPYIQVLEQSAATLGLTKEGKACAWAVSYLHDDVVGQFDPDRPPFFAFIDADRVIEISVSGMVSEVVAYRAKDVIEHRVESDGTQRVTHRDDVLWSSASAHQLPMMVGKVEWETLERLAEEAARRAVADLRDAVERRRQLEDVLVGSDRVRAGSQGKHELTIKRLAQRLAGWGARRDWNTPETDANWCAKLGIDPPTSQRK